MKGLIVLFTTVLLSTFCVEASPRGRIQKRDLSSSEAPEDDWKRFLLPPYMPKTVWKANYRALYNSILREPKKSSNKDDKPWNPMPKTSIKISPAPEVEDIRHKKEIKVADLSASQPVASSSLRPSVVSTAPPATATPPAVAELSTASTPSVTSVPSKAEFAKVETGPPVKKKVIPVKSVVKVHGTKPPRPSKTPVKTTQKALFSKPRQPFLKNLRKTPPKSELPATKKKPTNFASFRPPRPKNLPPRPPSLAARYPPRRPLAAASRPRSPLISLPPRNVQPQAKNLPAPPRPVRLPKNIPLPPRVLSRQKSPPKIVQPAKKQLTAAASKPRIISLPKSLPARPPKSPVKKASWPRKSFFQVKKPLHLRKLTAQSKSLFSKPQNVHGRQRSLSVRRPRPGALLRPRRTKKRSKNKAGLALTSMALAGALFAL